MNLKFLVAHERSKKIVEVKAAYDKASADEIKIAIQQQFNLLLDDETSLLEYFDRDFQDWVEIEPALYLENRTRLRIVTQGHEFIKTNSAVPLIPPTTTPPSSTSKKVNNEIENHNLRNTPIERAPTATNAPSSNVPWPDKYHFPIYALRADVLRKLQNGEPISRGERSNVTDAVYQDVTKYTYYPREWQYTDVVRSFLDLFPKVREAEGNIETAMNVWRQRIQYRFQNDRRRRDACIAGKRRLNRAQEEATAPPKVSQKTIWGLKNYLGQRPEGEDEASIKKHQMAMKNELKKQNPDQSQLDLLMDLTFADRREFITKHNPSVATIRENFPVLFVSATEILKEFFRIAEEGLGKKLDTGLQMYHKALFSLAKQQGHPLIKKLVENSSSENCEVNRQSIGFCASLVVVPLLLKEKLEHMITDKNDSQISPLIHTGCGEEGDIFTVLLDGEEIYSTNQAISAFEVYFACFFTFNLSYPESLKNSLQFFQRTILNIQDKEILHPNVYFLFEKLSQMVGSRDSILWDRTPDELGFAPETPEDSSDLTAGGGEHYGAHENGPIKEEMVEWVDEDLVVSEDNDKSREDTQSPVFPGVHVILNEAPGPARKKRKPQHYDDVQTATRGDTDYAAAAAAAAAVAFNSDPLTLVSKGLLLQHERNAKSPRSTSSPTEQHQQHQQHPVVLSEEEEDLFGRYVAATIKKFSSKSKSVAKMRIQHVLFEVEEAERLGKDYSLNISVNNGN